MACGLPVVGTTSATQGVGAVPGTHYRVADAAADFARATIELLQDEAPARALGAAARSYVEQHYNWEQVFRPLDDILEKCQRARATPS
jgi:glycosyltransferase involved in cell wall biosynthesis